MIMCCAIVDKSDLNFRFLECMFTMRTAPLSCVPPSPVLAWLLCARSPLGSSVGAITASDYDHDVFAFALLTPYPAVPVLVTRTGLVVVDGPLDFESQVTYSLVVAVNETGNGRGCSLGDATTVTVGGPACDRADCRAHWRRPHCNVA